MTQFFPNVCQQAHCNTCRASASGLRWRTEIAAVFRVPDDNINWQCPHGYAWDEMVPPPMPVPAESVAKIGETTNESTLMELSAEIEALGGPEWLKMKLQETKLIIGDERNCTSCVMAARCLALRGWIDDWKRLEGVNT